MNSVQTQFTLETSIQDRYHLPEKGKICSFGHQLGYADYPELVRRANLADKLQAERDALVRFVQNAHDNPESAGFIKAEARALLDSLNSPLEGNSL